MQKLQLLVFLVGLMAQTCWCEHHGNQEERHPENRTAFGPCSIRSCGGKHDPERYTQIIKYFRDNFYTRCQIYIQNWCLRNPLKCDTPEERKDLDARCTQGNTLPVNYRKVMSGTSDNDRCCATRRRYTLQVSGWKQSVDGNSYYILSLATGSSNVPNLFQTVNTGQCDVGGNCSGRCRQMNHFVSLVCLNMNGQLVIRLFEFNAYCSCQAAP